MKITKAVIPAAGYGTRFLPFTKASPKEMIPVVDKPVIQYIVEAAVKSGIEEIILITGQNKRSIEDHFDSNFELEFRLEQAGKKEELKELRQISELAKFVYIRQKEPLGNGHAVLCAKEVIGDEPFVVIWGDEIWTGEKPQIQQLLNSFAENQQPIISLKESASDEEFQYMCQRYGCIDGQKVKDNLYEIKSVVEKPDPAEAPSNLFSMGGYVLTPAIFNYLEKIQSGKGNEIWLVDALREMAKVEKVYGRCIEGQYYDIGNKLGFLKATVDFALGRADINGEFKEFLKAKNI